MRVCEIKREQRNKNKERYISFTYTTYNFIKPGFYKQKGFLAFLYSYSIKVDEIN